MERDDFNIFVSECKELKIAGLPSFHGTTEKLINGVRHHHVLLDESQPSFMQDLEMVIRSGLPWDTITGSVQKK